MKTETLSALKIWALAGIFLASTVAVEARSDNRRISGARENRQEAPSRRAGTSESDSKSKPAQNPQPPPRRVPQQAPRPAQRSEQRPAQSQKPAPKPAPRPAPVPKPAPAPKPAPRPTPPPPRNNRVSVNIGIGAPIGFFGITFGGNRYYCNRGFFYRQALNGYVLVAPPYGLIVPRLPIGYARVYRGSAVYYNYNSIWYRPCDGGYVVVQPPPTVIVQNSPTVIVRESVVVQPAESAEAEIQPALPAGDYQSIVLNDIEYFFKNGQFFKRVGESLVWCEAPLGAIAPTLPADAISVWHGDLEYFDCDGVCFRKTPDGYRVVPAPWKNAEKS